MHDVSGSITSKGRCGEEPNVVLNIEGAMFCFRTAVRWVPGGSAGGISCWAFFS